VYRRDLESLIKENTIPQNFLLYGDVFQLDYYEKKLLSMFQEYDVLKLYFDEFDFNEAKTHLSQNSLFGNKNLLIIKTDKNINKLQELIKINRDNNLILFFYGQKPTTKPFNKDFVRFFPLKYFEKQQFLNEYVTQNGLNWQNHIKEHILKVIDMNNFYYELDKLSLIENVTTTNIDRLLNTNSEISFDELFDRFFLKQEILDELKFLIEKGEDESKIILALTRYIKDLYLYYLHIKTTGQNSMQSFFGYKPPKDVEERRNRVVLSLNEEKFLNILDFLTDIELDLKSSYDKESLIFYTFLRLKEIV
jgi:DNA polymerase-3 subunit delta